MTEFPVTIVSKDQPTTRNEMLRQFGVGSGDREARLIDAKPEVRPPAARLTVDDLCGIVPPLPGRNTTDFEGLIEEAMDDEADRIVRSMGGR